MIGQTQNVQEEALKIAEVTIGRQKFAKFLIRNGITLSRVVGWTDANPSGTQVNLRFISAERHGVGAIRTIGAPTIIAWDSFEGVELFTAFNPSILSGNDFLCDVEAIRKIGQRDARFDAVGPITDIRQVRQYMIYRNRVHLMNPEGILGIAMARHDRENGRIIGLATDRHGKSTRVVSIDIDTARRSPQSLGDIEGWKTLFESQIGGLYFSRPQTVGGQTRIEVTLETAATRALLINGKNACWSGPAVKGLRCIIGAIDGMPVKASFGIAVDGRHLEIRLDPIILSAL
ncbi:MAG: hypothetical protein WCT54_05405 [Patescibacteria group bacterium]